MNNSQEANQPNNNPNPSDSVPQRNSLPPDFFCFLKAKENFSRPRPFFSENGLSQDILKVTNAEPDICLEAFYALYNTLWPQIAKQATASLKNAWQNFIGNSIFKGVLCPPEILMGKKKATDIKKNLSQNEGERQIFQDLDQVISSISHLGQSLVNYPDQLLHKEDILASLGLVEGFYQGYRDQVKKLAQALNEASSVPEYEAFQDELVDLLEPKAVMMSDIFPNHWAYRISRNKAQKLLSLNENRCPILSDSNEPANHRVTALPEASEPLVYFKANGRVALQPEKEFMLYSLSRHLQIPVPETALLILTNVFDGKPELFYAFQASEAVVGESAAEACKKKETIFEEKAFAEQVIGALLTNPSDGKFANFKFSPHYKTLIGIDNDLVFEPEFIGEDNKIVNIKSALYLLPFMDRSIPASVQTYFMTLDPDLIMLVWLHDLQRKNEECELLFTRLSYQNARNTFQCLLPENPVPSLLAEIQQQISVDSEIHEDKFRPQILVSKNQLKNLTNKFEKIKTTFFDNDSSTLQTLFEEVSPILGKYYRQLRLKFPSPKEALEAMWGEKINGVYYSNVSSLLNDEELNSLTRNEALLNDEIQDCEPFELFEEYKNILISEENSLDKLIRRHSEKKMNNLLNLQEVLKEFRFLKQEGLTDSKSFRDIVDFCSDLCKVTQEQETVQEIVSILFKLPQVELQWLLTLEKYFLRIENSASSESAPFLVHGAFLKQRVFNLTESEKEFLFDSQGNIKKNTSLTGRSRVTCFPDINPEFYLKQYPEWPGYEFASTFFMRLLGVKHLPYQELILNKNPEYPVLLTQKVDGNPVFKIWQDPEAFCNLDPFHTGLLIIAAILLNPEDGKEDNFILSPDGKHLIPIDNDHCFLPSTFQKKGDLWNLFTVNRALQTKTLLFCLDEMKRPIPLKVREHVISINFDSLLISWIEGLVKVEDRYNHLVDQEQRNAFLENDTILRIPFYEQFIHNLYWKVNKIQDLLKSTTKQTPFGLLRAVEPFAARCYEKSFQDEKTLQNRFKAATKELYIEPKNEVEKSRMSILNTRSMMNIINISEKDLQNDVTYNKMGPPDALELLKDLIQQRSQNEKLEQDLICEFDDKKEEGIWTTLFGDPVLEKALKSFFANPKEGLALKGSNLITESNLRDLFAQTPDQGTRIKFLSLPNNPQLDSKALRMLVEGCPNLEYLNVSECTKLEEIITSKGEWPLLARLEAKQCFNLKKIILESPIKILRVGTHQKIEISVDKSNLESFTIFPKTDKFDLWIEKDKYFHIKPPGETRSIDYFLYNARLYREVFDQYFKTPKITIATHAILSPKNLEVFITFIDLRTSIIDQKTFQEMVQLELINLKSLHLPKSNMVGTEIFQDLIKGEWPQLSYLDLFDNEVNENGLAILSQKKWPLLETLSLDNLKATKRGLINFFLNANWFHLSKFTSSRVIPPRTEFPIVLLQKNEHLLQELDLNDCQITPSEIEKIVNLPKWANLKFLNLCNNEIYDEGLAILSQGNWPLLETLWLLNVKITSVGIETIVTKSNWPKLKILNLSYNEIDDRGLAILPRGNWSLLEELYIHNTKVTDKGLLIFYLDGKWPKLNKITVPECVDFNIVSYFDQKKYSKVKRLELNQTEMTLIEIETIVNKSKFRKLKCLDLSNNQVFDDGISLLPLANWPLLEELNIENTNISSKGIENIVNQSKWKKLKSLNLSHNQIYDEGVALLAKWSLLEMLNLQNISITSKGIEKIVNQSNWQHLKCLNLSNNKICDDGISFLSLSSWPLLEELNIQNTNISSKGIMDQPKWVQLKYLNISNNPIFDQGLLMLAAVREWPVLEELHIKDIKITLEGTEILATKMKLHNLRKLDISENIIKDEGLETLASANWPSLRHLVYYDTQVTLKGNIALLETMNWPNLYRLEHSLTESFYNYNEDTSRWVLPKIILAIAPMYYQRKSLLVTVLDATWLTSKEICLSIQHNGWTERIMILPRNELAHFEHIKLSSHPSLIQQIVWPFNPKILDLSNNSFSDEADLQSLFLVKDPLLEDLNLHNTKITTKCIEILTRKFSWPFMKKLCISKNKVFDTGLKVLSSGEWPLLESLNLENTGIGAEGIQSLVNTLKWPNLKILDISRNYIYDLGLEVLSSGKWPLLEELSLRQTHTTAEGIKSHVSKSNWPKLKTLDISDNSFKNEGLELFFSSSKNWSFPENVKIRHISLTVNGIESLVCGSEWLNIKILDISDNSISDKGLITLFDARWPFLENLNLERNDITWMGMRDIGSALKFFSLPTFQASKFPSLKILKVADNPLGGYGLQFLFSVLLNSLEDLNLRRARIRGFASASDGKSACPDLKRLDVSDNFIYDTGLKRLSDEEWPLLESLNLRNTYIGITAIKNMIERSKWPKLKALDLSYNSISDKGLKILSSGKWPSFETLSLISTRITARGIKEMVKISNWPNLREIHLTDSVDNDVIETLISTKWPSTQVIFYK